MSLSGKDLRCVRKSPTARDGHARRRCCASQAVGSTRPSIFDRRRYDDDGAEASLFDRVAAGETLASIAKDYECSRSWLSRLLNEDEQREALLQVAKQEGAQESTTTTAAPLP